MQLLLCLIFQVALNVYIYIYIKFSKYVRQGGTFSLLYLKAPVGYRKEMDVIYPTSSLRHHTY